MPRHFGSILTPATTRSVLAIGLAAATLAWAAPGSAQTSPNAQGGLPSQHTLGGGPAGTLLQTQAPSGADQPRAVDGQAGQPGERIQLESVTPQVMPRQQLTGNGTAGALLQVRVSHLFPGTVSVDPDIKNPLAGDPNAAERGMKHFIAFNCVGCHAANGGGGMGPSLSDDKWIYGSSPANIYLTIVQGRPNGMPAWGAMLPDPVVWELVSYVESISKKPDAKFGMTISRSPPSPKIEQVSATQIQTPDPWQYTEPFSSGQRPQGEAGQAAGGGQLKAGSGNPPDKQ